MISVALVTVSVMLALKYRFGLPRPLADVQCCPTEPSPVGFPSGRAIAATAVYGGALTAIEAVETQLVAASISNAARAFGIAALSSLVGRFERLQRPAAAD